MKRSQPKDAYESALNLLSSRDHSREELRRKLIKKGCEAHDVAAAIERLIGNGLIDDVRFSTAFALSKLTGERAPSIRRVKQELQRRGVESAIADEAVASVVADERIDETGSLEAAARKKLLSMGDLEPAVRRRRLFSYLARKGYDLDDINRFLAQNLV